MNDVVSLTPRARTAIVVAGHVFGVLLAMYSVVFAIGVLFSYASCDPDSSTLGCGSAAQTFSAAVPLVGNAAGLLVSILATWLPSARPRLLGLALGLTIQVLVYPIAMLFSLM